jgi:hypothetical protein
MGLNITPGAGATLSTNVHDNAHWQGVLIAGAPKLPVGGTYHLASTNALATLAAPASANYALVRMDQGGWIRWSNAATPNGSLGMLLAGGSNPEALELVGTTMLGTFRFIAPTGETVAAKFTIEYYRAVV